MESTGGRITQFLLICLVFSVLGVAFVGVSLAQGAGGGDNGTVVWQTDSQQVQEGAAPEVKIDADDITMSAQIYENGTATLEIDYQIRLDSDADRHAFEEIQSEIASNESAYLGPFRERMNRTVAAAESATDREMTASGFAVSTDRNSQLQAEFGHVRYRFEWGGFAVVDDGTIRAGDAVDSLFLDDSESWCFSGRTGTASRRANPIRSESRTTASSGRDRSTSKPDSPGSCSRRTRTMGRATAGPIRRTSPATVMAALTTAAPTTVAPTTGALMTAGVRA